MLYHDKQGGALQMTNQWDRAAEMQWHSAHNICKNSHLDTNKSNSIVYETYYPSWLSGSHYWAVGMVQYLQVNQYVDPVNRFRKKSIWHNTTFFLRVKKKQPQETLDRKNIP